MLIDNDEYKRTIIPLQCVDDRWYSEYIVEPDEQIKHARNLKRMSKECMAMPRFKLLIRTVCNVANLQGKGDKYIAQSLFERCRDDVFRPEIMPKAWNIVSEIILKSGALPSKREIAIYKEFIKIAENTYNWKQLYTEEDNDDSTGPTLCFDVTQSNQLNELCQTLIHRLQMEYQQSVARGFNRPRCLTDECSVLKGSERDDAHCVYLFRDLHVWCVDEKNNILDYQLNEIDSDYWTENVIYRPFDAEHVSLIYKDVIEYAKQSDIYMYEICHMTEENKLDAIKNNTFPKRACIWRAKALRDRDPTRYSMVIGSLGFKQADGRIFWEYG